jgi:Thioredoxin
MNPLSTEIWESGLTYRQYRGRSARNGKICDEVYAQPAYEPEDLDVLRQLPPLKVLAIGEDWCPDVFHTLPTWARIAEQIPGWGFRAFLRDTNPELMTQFLWKNGAQRIPVFAFYDARNYLQVWWSGRGARAQKAMDDQLAGRTYNDLSADERKQMGEHLQEGYRQSFRRDNFVEMMDLLKAFFHVSPAG